MTLPDITLPLIVGSGLICIIIAGWWAFYRPRLALYALVVWAQFGPFLTKVTGSKLVLYATYVLPVALLLITALALPRKSLRVPRSSIVLFLGVFIAILIIQAFNPSLPDPTMGLAELASKFMLHISFFLLGIWLVRSESDLKGLLWALAIAGAIGGVYALYQQFVGFPSFENAWATGRSFQGFNVYLDQDRRVLSTLLYSAAYGLFSAVCGLMAIPLLAVKQSLLRRLALFVALTLSFAGMLLSLTRGVWVGVAISLAIWALFRWKYLVFRIGAWRILLALALLAGLALAIPSVRNRIITFKNVVAEQQAARFDGWRQIWLPRLGGDRLLTGYGLGLAGSGTERYYALRQAYWGVLSGVTDNSYLLLLVSTGIVGLIIFLTLVWRSLRLSYILQYRPSSPFLKTVAICLFLTLLTYYVDFLSSDQLIDSYPANAIFWLLLAVLVNLPRMGNEMGDTT